MKWNLSFLEWKDHMKIILEYKNESKTAMAIKSQNAPENKEAVV